MMKYGHWIDDEFEKVSWYLIFFFAFSLRNEGKMAKQLACWIWIKEKTSVLNDRIGNRCRKNFCRAWSSQIVVDFDEQWVHTAATHIYSDGGKLPCQIPKIPWSTCTSECISVASLKIKYLTHVVVVVVVVSRK